VLELGCGPQCEAIVIESRRSDRVPFGTGAAVNTITGLADPVRDFHFYDPAVFELLRHWLQSLPEIWQSGTNEFSTSILSDPPGDHDQCEKRPALLAGLKKMGTDRALDHAFRQSRDLDQFKRQMHIWFDAFRTLKLIHRLRDHLPSVSYAGLAANQTFCQLLAQDPELLALQDKLRQKLSADDANFP
jgi:hypothetical protein